MNIRATHHALMFLALLLWLMTSCMGVHSHFCFDGQEPAVSLHMDLVEGHEVHSEEEVHQDLDVSQSAFIKLLKSLFGIAISRCGGYRVCFIH